MPPRPLSVAAGTPVADVCVMHRAHRAAGRESDGFTGTTGGRVAFVISPEVGEDDRTVEMQPVRAPEPQPSASRQRILLVEPNCHLRIVRAYELRTRHSVATAPGVEGALRLLASERFDAALVTEGPEGEGLGLLVAIAVRWPAVRRHLLVTWREKAHTAALRTGTIHRLLLRPLTVSQYLREIEHEAHGR